MTVIQFQPSGPKCSECERAATQTLRLVSDGTVGERRHYCDDHGRSAAENSLRAAPQNKRILGFVNWQEGAEWEIGCVFNGEFWLDDRAVSLKMVKGWAPLPPAPCTVPEY